MEGEHQLVVATEVTANASDQGGLPLLLDEVVETFDEQPETVLADAGYSNERDLADLEARGIDGYVSLGRDGKKAQPRDPEQCPATNRMAEKLSTPAGRAAYAERKWLSEAPNGWIKHVLGCARRTGEGWPVRVRREEGITNHLHPESCAGRREAAGEALTGARTGRALLSIDSVHVWSAETVPAVEGHTDITATGEGMAGSTVSENPSTSVCPSPGPGRSSFRPGSRTGAAAERSYSETDDARNEEVG